MKEIDYSGCVIKSLGTISPEWNTKLLIRKTHYGYDAICLSSGFNIDSISDDFLNDYKTILPMEEYDTLDEYITDLIDGIERTGGVFKRAT